MAELADALDLGSSGQPPCRFKSCYPHCRKNESSLAYSIISPVIIHAEACKVYHVIVKQFMVQRRGRAVL